jgi:hypothetical protein
MVKTGSQANSSCNLSTITCTHTNPTIICSHNVPKCIQTRLKSVDLYPLVWMLGPLTCAFVSWAQNGHECYLSECTKKAFSDMSWLDGFYVLLLRVSHTPCPKNTWGALVYHAPCVFCLLLEWPHFCIKVLVPKLFWILQGYVGMAGCLTLCIPTQGFF